MSHLYDELLDGHEGPHVPTFCLREVKCDCPKCKKLPTGRGTKPYGSPNPAPEYNQEAEHD